MEKTTESEQVKLVKQIKTVVDVPYRYSYGRALTRFFTEIRDNGRLVALRCPCCRKIMMPPDEFCPLCFVEKGDDWVELPLEAKVVFFNHVNMAFPGQVRNPPYVFTGARIEGTEGVLMHILDPEDSDRVQIDSPLEIVLKPKEERKGEYFDILHFKIKD